MRHFIALAAFILLTFLAPAAGAFTPPGEWYQSLAKPTWNPPSWLFGPVWTALYLMMATAAWTVWRRVGWSREMMLYIVQLALNAAWTPLFFGAHQIGAALLVIISLWIAIFITQRAFGAVSRPAGLLLIPYLAWVSFATVLNFTLWRLNS